MSEQRTEFANTSILPPIGSDNMSDDPNGAARARIEFQMKMIDGGMTIEEAAAALRDNFKTDPAYQHLSSEELQHQYDKLKSAKDVEISELVRELERVEKDEEEHAAEENGGRARMERPDKKTLSLQIKVAMNQGLVMQAIMMRDLIDALNDESAKKEEEAAKIDKEKAELIENLAASTGKESALIEKEAKLTEEIESEVAKLKAFVVDLGMPDAEVEQFMALQEKRRKTDAKKCMLEVELANMDEELKGMLDRTLGVAKEVGEEYAGLNEQVRGGWMAAAVIGFNEYWASIKRRFQGR